MPFLGQQVLAFKHFVPQQVLVSERFVCQQVLTGSGLVGYATEMFNG